MERDRDKIEKTIKIFQKMNDFSHYWGFKDRYKLPHELREDKRQHKKKMKGWDWMTRFALDTLEGYSEKEFANKDVFDYINHHIFDDYLPRIKRHQVSLSLRRLANFGKVKRNKVTPHKFLYSLTENARKTYEKLGGWWLTTRMQIDYGIKKEGD